MEGYDDFAITGDFYVLILILVEVALGDALKNMLTLCFRKLVLILILVEVALGGGV